MQKPLTAVVVGTGFIGPVHVEGLRRAGVNIAGVIGSTPAKSQAAAARLGLPAGISTFEEALQHPEVDAIHLTTPNRYHFEQATAVLQAGKHVLCEKPLAMNSQETAELVRIAEASGRAAGVCYNIRFYPLCLETAARVRRGDFGKLYHVTGSYAQDWLHQQTDFNWRVVADDGGELRAVADIGTHWLDLVQFIAGQKITAVCADLQTVFAERLRPVGSTETYSGTKTGPVERVAVPIKTEDYGCLMLRFADGAKGVVWVSQVSAGRKNCLRFELAGAQQAAAWDSQIPNELWIGHRDQPNETLVRDPSLLSDSARLHADYPGGHNEGFPDTFKQLFRAFYSYVSAGDFTAPPTFPTFADGHREVLLCEAVLQSHRDQRWVSVTDSPS